MAFPSTYLDLQNAVIDTGRLDATNDLTKVKTFINRAYADVALVSKFFEGQAATSALAAGASNDVLPTALIELEDVTVTYGGVQPPLREVTWEQLLNLRAYTAAGKAGQGPPQAYSLRKNSLEFWPNAQGGEILTYYGSKQPDAWLSGDTDLPAIPEPFATSLLTYGALTLAGEFKADLLMLGDYQQQYGAWLAKFLQFCQNRMGTDARAFEVRLGRSVLLPHDPSSDFYVVAGIPWTA